MIRKKEYNKDWKILIGYTKGSKKMSAKKGNKKWMIIVAVVLVLALVLGLAIAGTGTQKKD